MHPPRAAQPLSILLLVAFGCGATVTVESSEGDGSPRSEDDGDGDGDGDAPPSDCRDICQRYEQAGCSHPGCVEACARAYDEPKCFGELVALNGCVAASPIEGACAFPPSCTSVYVDYITCSGEPTGQEPYPCTPVLEGEVAGGACSSFVACEDAVFSETCFGDGRGGSDLVCECAENGIVVGTCEEFDDSCDVNGGCCEFVHDWPY